MHKWLSVVGIGEDGLEGISAIGRSLIDSAEILVGGTRHLAMLPSNDVREQIAWASPLDLTIERILSLRGKAICVLASGDPMCHGVGVTLSRHIPITEITIVPSPSAFSLACARLGWSLSDIETFSLTHRPVSILASALYPHARILVLSADKTTPARVAEFLTQAGFGQSQIAVLERMGGTQERWMEGLANEKTAMWRTTEVSDLNTIAIACIPDPDTALISKPPAIKTSGLPDAAYHHDGQLTKREVRAITLSSLAPIPGELLWDVGAGCGSIAIEWMRSHPRCRAIAIERNTTRRQYIADNASALGISGLKIVAGDAPAALDGLPQPDVIFIGGGATVAGLFETCWDALHVGGRLVVNAVTLESEQKVLQWHHQHGGELIRIGIQRTEAIGSFLSWKPSAPITQWIVTKNE
ncbi:precorrin-6y C5,15-methyltransferase (decarboxylating) subunit CbiE [Tumidithrix helvetica PCC 7403]|uniref:precorrin-6y C5,15-methyltransferase (decarboxylating) subunit CbiE n=1 Tax=Tumidithrix helvetica TaxID=3457545 RepID=UPI003C87C9B1